jgi:hypothetical protein
MKTLILALVATVVFGVNALAQSAPSTPQTPQTTSKSNKKYSYSLHSDDDESTNSSVSITESEDSYRFKARFHKSRYEAVSSFLLDNLDKDGLTQNGKTYEWSHGDDSFSCKLTGTSLKMYLDYDSKSPTFVSHIKKIGNELKHLISGTSAKKMALQNAKRAQQDLERAQKDLERAQRDLERGRVRLEKKKN